MTTGTRHSRRIRVMFVFFHGFSTKPGVQLLESGSIPPVHVHVPTEGLGWSEFSPAEVTWVRSRRPWISFFLPWLLDGRPDDKAVRALNDEARPVALFCACPHPESCSIHGACSLMKRKILASYRWFHWQAQKEEGSWREVSVWDKERCMRSITLFKVIFMSFLSSPYSLSITVVWGWIPQEKWIKEVKKSIVTITSLMRWEMGQLPICGVCSWKQPFLMVFSHFIHSVVLTGHHWINSKFLYLMPHFPAVWQLQVEWNVLPI